jgi:glucokinase
MDVIAAADVGGTSTRVLINTTNGTEVARRVLPTSPDNYVQALRDITAATRCLSEGHRILAVGAGVAGAIEQGVVTGSGNLPGWIGQNVQADLERAFDAPSTVLNDAQAAGLGEFAVLGKSIVYVIWGTGVGACIVIFDNGHLIALPTELGHIIIDRSSKLRCGCGGYGHLEAHVSGGNIPKREFDGQHGIKAEHLTDHQWAEVLHDMAVGLRSISAGALGLPIVLGGGVATKQSHRLPVLRQMVGQLQSSCPVPELLLAKHGEDSGLVGAAYAAQQLAAVA